MTESSPKKKFSRRAKARPHELLDAAVDEFRTKGFAAARVDDIAKRAGVSKGVIYLYFPSKEALLTGLMERIFTAMAEESRALSAVDDPSQKIEAAIRSILARMDDAMFRKTVMVVLREMTIQPELAARYRDALEQSMLPALFGAIQQGVKSGNFAPVNPINAIKSIMGPIFAHLNLYEMLHMDNENKFDADGFTDHHVATVLAALRA